LLVLVAAGVFVLLILGREPAEEAAQLSSEDKRIVAALEVANRKYSLEGVTVEEQIAAVRNACAYMEDEETYLQGPDRYMASVLRPWAVTYGFEWERDYSELRPWLTAGMTQVCPQMAYRMDIIARAGALPPRIETASAEPLGKGSVDFRWQVPDWIPVALEKQYLTVPVVFQYRVDGGEWTTTSKSEALIKGLESGSKAFLEVRIVYGAPAAGGPHGEIFGMPVRVK